MISSQGLFLFSTNSYSVVDRWSITVNGAGTLSAAPSPIPEPGGTAGYPLYAWYAANTLQTNASVQILPDLWTNHLDLTNAGAASSWPIGAPGAGPNSAKAITFGGGGAVTYLRNDVWTNPAASAIEVVLVAALTNSGDRYAFSGTNSLGLLAARFSAGHVRIESDSGGLVANGYLTNKYAVFNFVFNGAASSIITNNVLDKTGSITQNQWGGIYLGASYVPNNAMNYSFVEMRTYRTNLSASARTTLFNYLTNYYRIGL